MLYKNILIFVFLLFSSSLVLADDSDRHLQVDGMNVYLGVIPAQMTQHKMYDNGDAKKHSYHVLIALYDIKKGKPVTGVKLKATVSPIGAGGHTKSLDLMLDGGISYGNFFVMHRPGIYRIRVEIENEKSGKKSIANFVYQRPQS